MVHIAIFALRFSLLMFVFCTREGMHTPPPLDMTLKDMYDLLQIEN